MQIDWIRFHELEKKNITEMTKEEWEFFKFMYHVEEVQAGLDGQDE